MQETATVEPPPTIMSDQLPSPSPFRFDEVAFRRQTFDGENCVWITLADGQSWAFPKVWISLRPTFSGGRLNGTRLYSSWGSEFDELVQALDQAAYDREFIPACISLAAYMLSFQYDLPDQVLEEILTAPLGEQAADNTAWIYQVSALSRGQFSPKGPPSPGAEPP